MSNYKVLIVDDLPENIQIVGKILKNKGIKVSFATNGKLALKSAIKILPDLILLDVIMPEMNGYDICKILKADESTKDIPIIFLTAKNESINIIKGFELGAVDFVTKPFNTHELLARVMTHLDLKTKTKQLKQINKNLEDKVKERTNDLKLANFQLEKLDEAKNNFLMLISHELRTPLNIIIGYADLLEDDLEAKEHFEFIKNIKTSAQSLTQISELALLFTSLKLENYKITKEKFNLSVLFNSLIDKFYGIINSKKIEVKQSFCPNNILLSTDKELISNCINILFDNAIKYSPPNSIIAIKAYESTKLKGKLLIEVRNKSNHVVSEKFNILEKRDVINHSNGIGLGLATVKLIMNTLSAEIKVFKNNDEEVNIRLIIPN